MVRYIVMALGALVTVCTVNAFDIKEYKAFLTQNATLTDAALLEQKKPSVPYLSSIGLQTDSYLYLDSIKQKYKLTDGELSLLAKNNFVVSERMSYLNYAEAFRDVFCKDMPIFLSTDAVLGTFHQSYDEVLIDVETTILKPQINSIIASMRDAFPSIAAKYSSLSQNVADVDLYLTVAAILSKNTNSVSTFATAEDVKKVTDAIIAEQYVEMPLFSTRLRKLDFSQFTVRGHYVKANLGDYFKTLMWIGRTEFVMASSKDIVDTNELKDLKRMSIDALILNEVLEQSGAKVKLAQMDSLLSVLIGESDNLTPSELSALALKADIKQYGDLRQDAVYTSFANKLKTAPEAQQKILSQVIMDYELGTSSDTVKYPVSFILLGQRFLVDSYIFGSVVYNKVPPTSKQMYRMMPDPLDAMYALGNNDALPLLKEDLKTYEYGKNLEQMRYLVDSYDTSFWNSSLYNTTLNALKTLNPHKYPPVANQPLFMRSSAWHQQKLNTQLVAWSQLRHDNILYGKQSYTPGVECSYPHGFVEPYPEFYNVLGGFARSAALRFGSVQNGSRYATFYNRVASLMDTIGLLASKELSGTRFTPEDSTFMSRMIALPAFMMCGGPSIEGWYTELLFSKEVMERGDFTIVDVHTQPTDAGGNIVGKVLHTSVGKVNLGVFLANSPSADFKPMAYIGPVSSYYQDTTLNFKRLTDKEWADSVNANKIPLRPDWVYSYLATKSGASFGTGRVLDGIQYVPLAVKNRTVKGSDGISFTPQKNGSSILLTLDKTSDVRISMFDMKGRVVVAPVNKQYSAGNHIVSLPGASGLYTVKVQCGTSNYSMPLFCVR